MQIFVKLLKGELSARRRKNVVQARSFAEMLEQTMRRYQNRAIEAAQVIEELIQLAKEMRTSRTVINRMLDPVDTGVTLATLTRASRVLGLRVDIRLSATRRPAA